MIFKVSFKKDKKFLVRIILNDGKNVWMTTTENVVNWCRKKPFKDGEKVDVNYTEKDGQYTATRVCEEGKGSDTPPPENNTNTTPEKTTTEKYKGTNSNYSTGYMKSKNPEESRQIRALSIFSSVTQAVQALAGHVDLNNLGEVIESLYDRFDKKLPKVK